MEKQQVIRHLEDSNLNIQNANASFLAASVVFNAYVNLDVIRNANFSPMFSFFDCSKLNPFYQMIKEEHIQKISRKNYSNYLKNHKSLDILIKKHSDVTLGLDEIWQEYKTQEKKGLTDKNLMKLLGKFIKKMTEWWHYGVILEDKCEIINLKIVPKFQKRHGLTEKEAFEIVSVLSHPKEHSAFNLEKKDSLKICLEILKNKKSKEHLLKNDFEGTLDSKSIKEAVNNYIKNNFWFKTDFYKAKTITAKFLLKDARQKIIGFNTAQIKKEIKEMDDNFEKIQDQKRKILKQIKLSTEDKNDINFSQKIIRWMDQRKIGTMKHFYYFSNILDALAKRLNMSYSELSFYTLSELNLLLDTGKKVNKTEISKRKNKIFIVYQKKKEEEIFYGDEAQEMFETATHADKWEIKGTVASTGTEKKFTGIVKIAHNPTNTKFNDQDILVTSMTRVEFVPLMRKAKAIITNEGGFGCHAAIVSRELGISCIVGTKIATKVLKDGDLVEIDTERGVVKILKKHKT